MKSYCITVGALKEIETLAEVIRGEIEENLEYLISDTDIEDLENAIEVLKKFGGE